MGYRNPVLCGRLMAVLLVAIGCGGSRGNADPETLREIGQGRVVGSAIHEGRAHAWRGLPYAAPPTGSLRWRAPRPPTGWEGDRLALESGSPCAQLGGDPILGEEDCLVLDVFAPAWPAEAVPRGADRRPVMFWIHGGGNSMGSGDQIEPSRLAADHDVVVVAINYRLGVFGWLSHPALRASAEDSADASGNFGTLDMIRALEWVRDEVAAFGGDPNRVTIFGESAGGVNVFSLLLSPRARGLFHAAIAQSGSPVSMTRAQAENATDDPAAPGLPGSSAELTMALLRQQGRASDREEARRLAAEMGASEIEGFLRALSTEEILRPFEEALDGATFPIYVVPNVIRDGVVIPRTEPLEAFGTPGGYTAVPFIAGSNRDESKLFFAMTSPHVSRTFGFPTGFENQRLYDLEGEYGGLVWRAMGVDAPLERMRGVQGPSVWGYRFDWDEEPTVLGTDLSKLFGAAHAVELLFVFGLTDLGFANRFVFEDPDSATILSRQMRSYWARFAHAWRPGRGERDELPEWSARGEAPGEPTYLIFDSPRDGGIRMGFDRLDRGALLRRVIQDPRFESTAERCGVLRNMVQWSDILTVEEYARVADGACADHPLESRLPFASLSHVDAG